jgi:hypothetical protein
VGLYVLAVAVGIALVIGVERLFDVHVPELVHRAVVLLPLTVLALTPKKRRRRKGTPPG